MRQLFLSIEKYTTGFALIVAILMLAIASCLGMFQIITRFVIEKPAEWTEVLIRFSLIWMVFMGIAAAFRQGAMVSVDVLYRLANPKGKRFLDGMVCLAALVLMGIILWWGLAYAEKGKVQTTIGLENVSMYWAYLAMPVGAVFSIIGIVANFLDPQRLELDTAQ
jgi:TRAP-type C4-dicarboxylate transport system permease small subunit